VKRQPTAYVIRSAAIIAQNSPAERRPVLLGVARRAETRDYAVAHGILDEALDADEAIAAGWFGPSGSPAAADLVVIPLQPVGPAPDPAGRLELRPHPIRVHVEP
jgi:hypothetical protein